MPPNKVSSMGGTEGVRGSGGQTAAAGAVTLKREFGVVGGVTFIVGSVIGRRKVRRQRVS